MNYWLVTTEYPPFFGGGIATYCVHSARMLSEAGHTVTVIVGDRSLPSRERVEQSEGIRIVRFKAGDHRIFTHLGWNAALSFQISDLIADLVGRYGRPDVIEFQDCSGPGYWTIQRRLTGDPILRDLFIYVCVHTPGSFIERIDRKPIHAFPNYWIGEMERFCIVAADLVAAPSHLMITELAKQGFKLPQDVAVIRNPFRATNVEFDESKPARELVCVGRIQQFKGVPRLLASMSRLWSDGFDVPLRLIGGDTVFAPNRRSMREILAERYAAEVQKGLLRFDGIAEPARLASTIGRPLAMLFPSLFDNFPYTVVESLAAGQMVITSKCCGGHEIINQHHDGWLCDFDRPATIVDAIADVSALSTDARNQVSTAAMHAVELHCGYQAVLDAKLSAIERAKKKQTGRRIFPFARDIAAHLPAVPRAGSHVRSMLSVVVPYFNMHPWIGETLDSLSSSSYTPMEVIIVNDGSTDKASIDELCELKKRSWPFELRILSKKNGGLASARNAGADIARGEFLAILDADDLVTPDYYASAVSLLRQYDNIHFVGCWVTLIGGEWGPLWVTWNPEPPLFLYTNRINTAGLVFRTTSFLAAGTNDPKMEYGLEDWEAAINMLTAGLRGVAIPRPLFHYRIRPGSMLQTLGLDAKLYLYQVMSEKHAKLFSAYATDLIGFLNCNGPWVLSSCPTWEHPPIVFQNANNTVSFDPSAIPIELRESFAKLWRSRMFRAGVRLFFILRVDRGLHGLAKLRRRNRNVRK
jgi:glycosyltransferase involved in cell wall biosynthesis